MKANNTLLAATLLALAPLAASADGLSYTYAEAGYASADIDGVSDDPDGFVLRGSVAIGERFFAYANYLDLNANVEVGPASVDADFQTWTLGGGAHFPVSDRADFIAKLGYVKADAEVNGFDADDDGYTVGVALRGRLIDRLELEGGVNYVELNDSGDDTSAYVGARYFLTDAFSLNADYDHGDDASTWGVGLRYSFR